jgi:hypothetical protein
MVADGEASTLAGFGEAGSFAWSGVRVIQRSPEPVAPQKTPDPAAPTNSSIDLVSDVPLSSGDFWSTMMTRTIDGYGRWIEDTRDAINAFAVDVDENTAQSGTANFGATIVAWIGAIPAYGSIAQAAIKTLQVVSGEFEESPDAQLSVAAMTDRERTALQALSVKLQNVNSDLPIFRALREIRDTEKANPAKDPSTLQRRRESAEQINAGLAGLPKPQALRQRLALAWLRQGSNTDASFDDRNQAVEISCWATLIIEGFKFGVREIGGLKIPDATKAKLGKLHGYRFENFESTLLGRAKNELGMTTALKHAYGNAPLLDLPLSLNPPVK